MITYIIGFFVALAVYQEITFFLIKRRIKGPIKVMKGGEPFFIKKGKKAALLIHGFTSTPQEVRGLGNFLAKNNITVYAPLLPGHGTSPERLAITKYYQWIESVEEALKLLTEEYKEIYLIGNSMGGNLALILGNKSKKIKGIVAMGTPIFFRRDKINRYLLLPILKRIKLFQRKKFPPEIEKITKRKVHYKFIPLRSLKQLAKIINLTKKNLENITVPTLVMETDNDKVISNESGTYILDNIKSHNKRLVRIPESYHVFVMGEFKKRAWIEVLKFIKPPK